MIAKWEPLLGVSVNRFFVQRMKTKWGSCNHDARTIRLNTDLAKKPPECLEYLIRLSDNAVKYLRTEGESGKSDVGKKKKNRGKRQGHFCSSCGSSRSNESFSGKGHAGHLCKQCAKLGADELAYRQALRNLELCVTLEGIIPRKRRQQFLSFLEHSDPRIREIAREFQEQDLA